MKRFVQALVWISLWTIGQGAFAADAITVDSTSRTAAPQFFLQDTGENPPAASSDALADALKAFNERRRKETIVGMTSLISWAAVSMGSGAVGWFLTEDEEWKGFHRSNITWGAINMGIAVPALVMTMKQDPASYGLGQSLKESYNLRFSHGFNAGLDVGYMVAGAWLLDRGKLIEDPHMVGIGRSMIIQGGALLLYDVLFLFLRELENKRLMAVPVVGDMLGMKAMGRF